MQFNVRSMTMMNSTVGDLESVDMRRDAAQINVPPDSAADIQSVPGPLLFGFWGSEALFMLFPPLTVLSHHVPVSTFLPCILCLPLTMHLRGKAPALLPPGYMPFYTSQGSLIVAINLLILLGYNDMSIIYGKYHAKRGSAFTINGTCVYYPYIANTTQPARNLTM